MKKIFILTAIAAIFISSSILLLSNDIKSVNAAVYSTGSVQNYDGASDTLISISGTVPDEYGGDPINVSESILLVTVAYRYSGSALDMVNRVLFNGSENFTKICSTADGEYGIELWQYHQPPTAQGYTIDVEFLDFVDSRFVANNFFSNVDENYPIGDTSCVNGEERWIDPINLGFTQPSATVNSNIDSTVFSAVMSYSDSNSLSPASSYNTIEWNEYNSNIVTSALTIQGDNSVTVDWDMASVWPWSMFAVSLNSAGPAQIRDPDVFFSDYPPNVIHNSQNISFTGGVIDYVWAIDSVTYTLTNLDSNTLIDSGYASLSNEYFGYADWDVEFTDLLVGNYRFSITGVNEVNNTDFEEFDFEIRFDAPICEMENLPVLQSNSQPTYTAHCSDTMPIDDISFRVYRVLGGFDIPFTTVSNFLNGSLGDNYIEVQFTVSSPIPDGATIIELNARNSAGASIPAGSRPVDYIVVETIDSKPPILVFNEFIPNPTVRNRPFVTGTCRDTYQFEVNSNIANVEYRLNLGAWTEIPAFDGAYDSNTEIFSIQLDELAIGSHSIEVRCADTAGNSTEDNSTNKIQVIEIIAPAATDPEEVTFVEDFTTRIRNALAYTNAIWGNGIVRLRDTISIVETALDTNNFGGRYESLLTRSTYRIAEGTQGLLWYVKENEFVSYNKNTGISTVFPSSQFGLNEFNDIAQVENVNGDILVWVTSRHGLLLVNVTNNTHTIYTTEQFWSPIYWPNRIAVDTRDGRVGAYIRLQNTHPTFNSNLIYIDTGSNFTSTGDDQVRWILPDSTINTGNSYHIMLDEEDNKLYVSTYLEGLGMIYDAGDPLNSTNDIRSFINNGGDVITDMALDKDNNVMFVTDFIGSTFRVIDFNTSVGPTDISGSTVTSIVFGTELGGFIPEHIRFLPGPEYVGGQLFIGTREGVVLYYNTNGTYVDTLDDNLIILDTAQNVYPLWVSGLVIDDYNTLYITKDRQGFSRVDLTRGWESLNTAVSVAGPSQDKQFINHISLDSLEIVARIDSQGNPDPNSLASVVNYISLDDGITWDEISVGENKVVNEFDNRLKFKMDLSTNPGTSPVVNRYSLRFASYSSQPQVANFEVTVTPTLVNTNQNFQINVLALDDLGLSIPNYSNPITVELVNAINNEVVSISNGNITNGESVIITSVNTPGAYFIRISDGSVTGSSNTFVVIQIPIPTPITPPPTNVGTPAPGFNALTEIPTEIDTKDDVEDLEFEDVDETDEMETLIEIDSSQSSEDVSVSENMDLVSNEVPYTNNIIPLIVIGVSFLIYSSMVALYSFPNLASSFGLIVGILIPRKRKFYGQVIDAKTGEAIYLANILLKDRLNNIVDSTMSDENGLYRFQISTSGEYTIVINLAGFEVFTKTDSYKKDHMVTTDIQLIPNGCEQGLKQKMRIIIDSKLRVIFALITILAVFAGLIWSIYALTISFSLINIIILIGYILIGIGHYRKIV